MKDDIMKSQFEVKSEDLIKKIKELINKGNLRKIIIKNAQGEIYFTIPLNIGIAGLVLAPVWAALGAIAALASNFTIEVEKSEKKE